MLGTGLTFLATFLGWFWATVWGVAAFIPPFNQFPTNLGLIVWGLLFLPPLWRYTWRLSKKAHLWGRVGMMVCAVVLITAPGSPGLVAGANPIAAPSLALAQSTLTTATPTTAAPQAFPSPAAVASPAVAVPEPERAPAEPSAAIAPSSVEAMTPIRAAVSGSCDCPYDMDRRGRSCGGRSAYSRPGGEHPICYVGDRF